MRVFKYDFLLIPGTLNGNIFITVQPPRGFGRILTRFIIHRIVPRHHYLAFYSGLRDIWGADAMVHVGTHGSLEYSEQKLLLYLTNVIQTFYTGDLLCLSVLDS